MSNKDPRIPTFDLAGIAGKIQILQTTLADNLSWLEHSFGVADRHEKNANDEPEIIPVAFVDNTTDPIDLRPFPYEYESYAFWHVDDPGEISYPNEELNLAIRKFEIWRYAVSLIIVADTKRIDDGPYNETKSKMKEDVLEILRGNVDITFGFWLTQVYEKDVAKIFDPYTIEKPEGVLKQNIVGFRFDGIVEFKQKCPISNTYSVIKRN